MNDDQMDELLIQGARDYNEPGEVPREEMWERIARARRAAREAETGSRPTSRRWSGVSVGVAAALLLAVGIVIGRRLERTTPTKTQAVAVRPSLPVAPKTNDTVLPDPGSISASNDPRVADAGTNLAYRLVVLQHLAGSEAMILSFRSSARRGDVDTQIAAWSRELLSTTRMLETSPAAQDPTMKRLLEDLELVIVQIAQYTKHGTNNPDELDLIEQSINKRGVIAKLRSALPARNIPAGT